MNQRFHNRFGTRRLSVAVGLALLLAVLAWAKLPDEVSHWHAALAREAELNADYAKMAAWATRAIETAPHKPDWYLLRAEARSRLKQWKEAARDLDEAVRHGVPEVSVRAQRAELLLHLGRPKAALKEWKALWKDQQALSRAEGLSQSAAWLELVLLNGLAYHRALAKQELPAALEDARRIVRLRDDIRLRVAPNAYLALCGAKTHMEVGDSKQALRLVGTSIGVLRTRIHYYQRRATAVANLSPHRYHDELKALRGMLVASYVEQHRIYGKLKLKEPAAQAADFVSRLNGDLEKDGWGVDLYGGIKSAQDLCQYVDTLAVVELELGEADASLRHADLAVRLAEALPVAHRWLLEIKTRQRVDTRFWQRQQESLRPLLAVLVYHRGLARKASGDMAGTKSDFDRVRSLGFQPGPHLF